jgi:nucleolar protein 15
MLIWRHHPDTGPEWESSDEEMVEPKASQKIATKKNADKPKSKSKKQLKREETEDSRVIYLGHIPPAFEESQLLQFLSQFGKVTNVKLSRSRRTGNPRGYAFVEFAENEVAAVVADTMSGYFLMGERRLVCHIVPQDKIHPDLFRGARENLALSQAGITSSSRLKILHDNERTKVNGTKSLDQMKKITKRLLIREKKKREQLKALGIDYDFPGYTASISPVESKKKRKVSVDENEHKGEAVAAPKKTKETPKKSAKRTRKNTEDSGDANGTPIRTPAKKNPPRKAKTEGKKKSKSASKKRRQSID